MKLFDWRRNDDRLTSLEDKIDLLLEQSSAPSQVQSAVTDAVEVQFEERFVHPATKKQAIAATLVTTFIILLATYSLAWSHRLADAANDLNDRTNEMVRSQSEARAAGISNTRALDQQIAYQSRLSNDAKNKARYADLWATSIVSLASACLGAEIGWVMTLTFDKTTRRVVKTAQVDPPV